MNIKRIVVYPYKKTSKSAKKLLEYLKDANVNAIMVGQDDKYTPAIGDSVLGWGSGYWPEWRRSVENSGTPWLNPSNRISNSVDKEVSFELFRAANVEFPVITTRDFVAKQWLESGHKVLARTVTDGEDGEGVVFMTNPKEFTQAKLYSKYMEKTEEYRVHVFNGKAFWSQERHPIEDDEEKFFRKNPNPYIRTSSNGWTLYVANKIIPEICKKEAEKAIKAIGLDFGAVDIGWYKPKNHYAPEQVCVYEVNTAPELSDRTADAYVKTIKLYMEQ